MTRTDGHTNELCSESNDPSTTVAADSGESRESDSTHSHEHEQSCGNKSVPPGTRADVLARDSYRCQVCGRKGPERGGLATLHAHHIERNPDDIGEDDLENLTTLCRSCHSWVHQQSKPADAPVTLTEADLSELLPQDIEILQYLADNGPARTGAIADALTADLSVTAVRERLALLMGLDNRVEERDRQIVDQDVDSGEWGLTEQIEHSARGHIPDTPQALLQRMEDEQVRQALERGCDRQAIMAVLDISRRTTFNREKRANAYDFPLDAFRGGGGRPTHDDQRQEPTPDDTDPSESTGQQQVEPVNDVDTVEPGHASAAVSDAAKEAIEKNSASGLTQEQLQMVISALERVATEP